MCDISYVCWSYQNDKLKPGWEAAVVGEAATTAVQGGSGLASQGLALQLAICVM